MNLEILFWLVIALLVAGWGLCSLAFFRNKESSHILGERLLFVGFLAQLLYVVAFFIEGNALPYDDMAGLFLFGSLMVLFLFFLVDFYIPNDIFEVIFPPIGLFFLLIAKVLLEGQGISTQAFLQAQPVFGRAILFTHASLTMLGYLLFGVACATSIFFLVQEYRIKNKSIHLTQVKLPSLGYLDHLNHRVISAGFMLISVGLMVGILMRVLSHQGAGGISLRQILPFCTWGVYAFFLLDRSIKGMIGRISAIWAILGFLVVAVSFSYEIAILMESRVTAP